MEILKSRRCVITTKYLPPTNTKGGRVKATVTSRPESVTVSWHVECRPGEDAHDVAARDLCNKMGWTNKFGNLYRGDVDRGAAYLFID